MSDLRRRSYISVCRVSVRVICVAAVVLAFAAEVSGSVICVSSQFYWRLQRSKSVLQKCQERVSSNSVLQERRLRVSSKSVLQK